MKRIALLALAGCLCADNLSADTKVNLNGLSNLIDAKPVANQKSQHVKSNKIELLQPKKLALFSINNYKLDVALIDNIKHFRHDMHFRARRSGDLVLTFPVKNPLFFDLDVKSSANFEILQILKDAVVVRFHNLDNTKDTSLLLSYKVENTNKFIQNLAVFIPSFAQNFKTNINIALDKKWDVFSTNPHFTKQGNVYKMQGMSRSRDFLDNFWVSLAKASWEVEIDGYVYTSRKINDINIFMPRFFKHSDYEINNIALSSNLVNSQMKSNKNSIFYTFRNAKAQDFKINLKANISNSTIPPSYSDLDPKKFLPSQVNPRLRAIAQKIVRENRGEPPHIAIGKWVFEKIHYNERLTSSHMSSEKILSISAGVCEHYAQLYNDLMQAYGVPSIFITGVGFNTYKNKFEYHAWNLVFVNNKWVPVDTTWGIFSGKMPISHIFFYTGFQPLIMYQTYDIAINDTHTEVSRKIKFIDNDF